MNDVNSKNKYIVKIFILIVLIIIFTVVVMYSISHFNFVSKEYYTASDFHIKTIYSSKDYDNDALDDYSDFVLGARQDAENHPKYVSSYYEGGYPRDNEGVFTDVIWRAFKNAGYSLRDMVNQDILLYPEDYKDVGKPDINIDFRRVHNLKVFFNKYSISLTLDPSKIEEWQPGDIVIFRNNKHIGIISDRRNKKGIPYVIHNSGQTKREEDYLLKDEITGHYRFDASLIPEEVLIAWHE